MAQNPQNIDFGDPIQFGSSQATQASSAPQQTQGFANSTETQQAQGQAVSASQIPRQEAIHVEAAPLPRFNGVQGAGPQQVMTVPAAHAKVEPSQAPRFRFQGDVKGNPLPAPGDMGEGMGRTIMMILIGVVVLAILVGVGYFIYARFFGGDNAGQAMPQVNSQANTVTNTSSNASSNKDEDDDGLLNFEEDQYGTDKLNADTDGDGFKDGDEVEKGFNPKGDGKLPTPGRF